MRKSPKNWIWGAEVLMVQQSMQTGSKKCFWNVVKNSAPNGGSRKMKRVQTSMALLKPPSGYNQQQILIGVGAFWQQMNLFDGSYILKLIGNLEWRKSAKIIRGLSVQLGWHGQSSLVTCCQLFLCLQLLLVTLYCVSRQQMHEQDSKSLAMKEELVMLKESLQSTCLQRDVLHLEKHELGLYTIRVHCEP